MRALIPALCALLFATSAAGQADHHDHHDHAMPPAKSSPAAPGDPAAEPPPPTDHAADRIFDPKVMAAARAASHAEHGGGTYAMVLLDLAEFQFMNGKDGYRWEGEAWYGGDVHRLVLKTEGEGDINGATEDAEVQALYSRAVGPYFNLQAGVRGDFRPTPQRVYAAVGVEGLAPYFIKTDAALFVSDKGDVLARFELSYDQLITQRLVVQPRVEMNFAAQDVPANEIGAGLSEIELGLRLRYEFRREFAPYIGVNYTRKVGNTAGFARAAGERTAGTGLVVGIRTWF